jgi:MoxR-like ATPase
VVGVVRKTREVPGVMLGASSRAAIHLVSAAKASARLDGRDAVTLEDVRAIAPTVLQHRLICEKGQTPQAVLEIAVASPLV